MKKDTPHNIDRLHEAIRSYTGDEEPKYIKVHQEVIHFVGDTKKALLLSYLILLSDRGKRKDGLVYKTHKEVRDATGLSEDQVRSYYNEFKEKGFFNWDPNIKANGFRTVHFKLDFAELMNQFHGFLRDRSLENSVTGAGKSPEPITEDTADNTNISKTLSSIIISEEEAAVNRSNMLEQQLSERDFESFLFAIPDVEPAVPLRGDFEPSLDNRFWGVSNYPEKPLWLATQSFIDYHRDQPEIKKTATQWQVAWRKWFNAERPSYGFDEWKLEAEREAVISEVRGRVHRFALESSDTVMRREDFYDGFGEGCLLRFSKETIDACVEELVRMDKMSIVFGSYLYTPRNWRSEEGQLFWGWNNIDEALWDYILENKGVSRFQIGRKFPRYCQKSIDEYLDSGVRSRALALDSGLYWEAFEYPGWKLTGEELAEASVPLEMLFPAQWKPRERSEAERRLIPFAEVKSALRGT